MMRLSQGKFRKDFQDCFQRRKIMGQQLTGASPAAMLEGFARFNLVQLSSRFLQWQNSHLQVARKDLTGIGMSKCTTGLFWNARSSLVGCHIFAQKTGSKFVHQDSSIVQFETPPTLSSARPPNGRYPGYSKVKSKSLTQQNFSFFGHRRQLNDGTMLRSRGQEFDAASFGKRCLTQRVYYLCQS